LTAVFGEVFTEILCNNTVVMPRHTPKKLSQEQGTAFAK